MQEVQLLNANNSLYALLKKDYNQDVRFTLNEFFYRRNT